MEGRVALVTGAGRGIGRAHALLFAAEGAKVVVNDLGAAPDGKGADTSAAQSVVDEITAAGGHAVANTDSVASADGAKAMVAAAVEAFGDLHVVVNNAGIVRGNLLVDMSEADFDAVVDVNLKGTFNVMRQAALWWTGEHEAGRRADRAIVNTSSAAGLHGMAGLTNYAAAKAGVAAMTLVGALELGRLGIRVNCIAPVARTRLTLAAERLVEPLQDPAFDPENIAPLAVCLAAEDCTFNGQVFSVYGGGVGLYAGWSIAESVTPAGGRWTVDELRTAMQSFPLRVEVETQLGVLQPR